jgi:type IV fimbrial biogenesis protein FimT
MAASTSGRSTTRATRGFTLLELMFTLTVAAVLLGIGVPSFIDIVRNNRATTNINELSSAFAIARSESIRRGANVSICRSSDAATCGMSWADGWIVFLDTTAAENGAPTVGTVIRAWGTMPGNPAVTTFANAVATDIQWVRFVPRGGVRTGAAMPLTMSVVPDGCSGDQARTLELNTVGRTTVARTACP